MENQSDTKVRWGVMSLGGKFYPARDKEQAEKWAKYDYGEFGKHLNASLATSDAVFTVMRHKAPEHTQHVLSYNVVGMTNVRGDLTVKAFRKATLDETPPWFMRMEGSYAEVSAQAEKLNQVQIKSNFLDYLYYPTPQVEEDEFAENVNLEYLWALPAYVEDVKAA